MLWWSFNRENNNSRPEIKRILKDISDYEVIYIGGPIYWGTFPMSMFTQLEKLNFTGKKIMVFTTHEGSGLGNSVTDIQALVPNANVETGLAIQGSTVNTAKPKVEAWINN